MVYSVVKAVTPYAASSLGPRSAFVIISGGDVGNVYLRREMKVLERVDDDLVGSSTSIQFILDTKQCRDLTSGNVDSTARHETRNSRLRN